MNFGFIRPVITVAVILGVMSGVCSKANGQGNGIFADFTTSLGTFTCQLDYTNAPRTTANFIGLATGQRAWLDLPTGSARTNAFYDGLTFHRVIAGFMIQGGSRDGTGDDGPGYAFTDEFSPQLTFANPWVLAMANSGPDSNGSQVFVTVEPFTSGNNVYAIFGNVTSGTNVVSAINLVATGANNKPLTNVVIQHVAIRRVGTAANAFDINAQSLPVVTNLPLKIAKGPGKVSLTFSNRLYADNRLYTGTNLANGFSPLTLGIETTTGFTNTYVRFIDSPQRFFSLAQVQYASSTFAPKSLFGRIMTLNISGAGPLTITFDSSGRGAYTFPPYPSGSVTNYTWIQNPYQGLLWPIYYDGLNPMTLDLNFTNSSTSGGFSGTVYPTTSPSFGISGGFTLTGP
jgi:peptidyl-prolyl cis-trans isomerase A (cyclophilin A)